MADVLAVPAFQFRDPGAAVVLSEPDDGPIHVISLAASGLRGRPYTWSARTRACGSRVNVRRTWKRGPGSCRGDAARWHEVATASPRPRRPRRHRCLRSTSTSRRRFTADPRHPTPRTTPASRTPSTAASTTIRSSSDSERRATSAGRSSPDFSQGDEQTISSAVTFGETEDEARSAIEALSATRAEPLGLPRSACPARRRWRSLSASRTTSATCHSRSRISRRARRARNDARHRVARGSVAVESGEEPLRDVGKQTFV